VFQRFNDWSKKGVFEKIFEAVSGDPDMEYAMIDITIVQVHRYGHGAKGDSRSGNWQVEGWMDHESPRPDRRARQSGAVQAVVRRSL